MPLKCILSVLPCKLHLHIEYGVLLLVFIFIVIGFIIVIISTFKNSLKVNFKVYVSPHWRKTPRYLKYCFPTLVVISDVQKI